MIRYRKIATAAVVAVLTVAGCSTGTSTAASSPDRTGGASTASPPAVFTPAAGRQSSSVASSASATRTVLTAQKIRGPGRWTKLTVAVKDSIGHRNVYVFTPDVAHPELLPVLYLLHGLPANIRSICNDTATKELDDAFTKGAAPFIVACPDATVSHHKDNEWGDSIDGRDHIETFVIDQARKAVEGNHPRPRSMRAIGGLSMGGYGAAAIALRHPSLYGEVVPMAGYFVVDDPSNMFGRSSAQMAAHNPTKLVAKAKGQTWLLLGAIGDHERLSGHANEEFLPLLRRAGATASFRKTAGDHNSAWALAQLPLVASLLSPVWGR